MTTNLLDWDEDLQTNPDEEYQALLNGLKRSHGFGLYFVQCSPFSGGKLIQRIKTDLSSKTIDVLNFERPIVDGNVFKRISECLSHRPVDVLFIQGLENSLFDAEETKKRLGWNPAKADAYTWRDVPPVLINLNQQRERFRDNFATCFVFLLPQYAINYIIHRAPDFFDWRSGLVNYASDPETLAQESERILDESDYEAYCGWSPEERNSRILEIQSLLEESDTTQPTKARLFLEQGLLFGASSESNLEIVAYDKAIQLKPDYHKALNNKGTALAALSQKEAAIACYNAALAIKPDDHYALNNKGNALAALGQNEAAIACYDAALAIKPDVHQALYNKGLALAALGQKEAAIACYNAALAINPNLYQALYNKACCYALQGDVDNATQCLQAAIDLDPKYRELAKTKTAFDPIRSDERFRALVEG
jgi:tetratricopeptide (TPR) repeat protein